jgi:hypothetical protein
MVFGHPVPNAMFAAAIASIRHFSGRSDAVDVPEDEFHAPILFLCHDSSQ